MCDVSPTTAPQKIKKVASEWSVNGGIVMCTITLMLERYDANQSRNVMLTRSFLLICFGKAMRTLIGKALSTWRASFVF